MDTLFLDYENSLINRMNAVGAYNFFGAEPGGANQQRALSCIRYALEKVLEWDVEDSLKKFDSYMIHTMKLERIISFINWPSEIKPGNARYILSLLYPERIKLNYQQLVEEAYINVLEKEYQFPREYFIGSNGFKRFCICFQYLITNYKPFHSLPELYEFMLSPKGKSFLYQYRLKVPADQLQIRMIDCIHIITKEETHSDFFFSYYDFMQQYSLLTKNEEAMAKTKKPTS